MKEMKMPSNGKNTPYLDSKFLAVSQELTLMYYTLETLGPIKMPTMKL